MTEIIQQLLEGEKPSEEILSFFNKLTHEFQIPMGEPLNIGGRTLPIRDIGDAMNLKITLLLPSLVEYILKKSPLQEEDMRVLSQVKFLISYWYARKWLPPLRDYSHLLSLEARPESETYLIEGQEAKMYLTGRKPPNEILSFVESYIDGIHVPSNDGGIAMSFVHGAGSITPSSSPVDKVNKYIQAGGAKLAKDLWGLEDVETHQERERMYRECSGLVLFWTMKGWLSIISPFATYEDLIRKFENKENNLEL